MRQELQMMTDRQLLQAYAAGRDLRAFEAFVTRHEGALLSFAAAYLRCEATAQDVVQEAFLRVARYPHRALNCDGTSERNWLLKIVRDLSVDSLRRRALERKAVKELAAVEPQTAPAPDALAEGREDAAEVRGALDRCKAAAAGVAAVEGARGEVVQGDRADHGPECDERGLFVAPGAAGVGGRN